jgi:hypothetical protein
VRQIDREAAGACFGLPDLLVLLTRCRFPALRTLADCLVFLVFLLFFDAIVVTPD